MAENQMNSVGQKGKPVKQSHSKRNYPKKRRKLIRANNAKRGIKIIHTLIGYAKGGKQIILKKQMGIQIEQNNRQKAYQFACRFAQYTNREFFKILKENFGKYKESEYYNQIVEYYRANGMLHNQVMQSYVPLIKEEFKNPVTQNLQKKQAFGYIYQKGTIQYLQKNEP